MEQTGLILRTIWQADSDRVEAALAAAPTHFQRGRAAVSSNDLMLSMPSVAKYSPAGKNWASYCPARKARRRPKASARPRVPVAAIGVITPLTDAITIDLSREISASASVFRLCLSM